MTTSSPYLRRMLAIDLAEAAMRARLDHPGQEVKAAIDAVEAILAARGIDVPDNREETTGSRGTV